MTGPGDRDGVGRCPTLAGTSDLAGNGFLDVTTPQLPATLGHSLTRMTGRDPNEPHRTATPLELLFDLAFVAAFGQAADQLAHLVAEGHLGSGIGGFAFAMFAICWAWINFTWFASAYDTDDWFFRITTMVQMVGVVVLALGMPPVFHSIDEGHTLDNRVMVAGYVIMRVAMVAQWLRAAKQDPSRRRIALSYAGFIVVAQVGWVVLAVLHLDLGPTFAVAAVLYLIEVGGPVMAERMGATGVRQHTPWHAHHIAERYGLLTIIALGEGVFGTIASVSAVVEGQGWTLDAAIVAVAGVGLTFGLWWGYFTLPSGLILHHFRSRVLGLGLRPHPGLRRDRGHRRRTARGRARGGGRVPPQRVGRGARGGDPGAGVPDRPVRAVHLSAPDVRSLPHRSARRHHRLHRARRGAG